MFILKFFIKLLIQREDLDNKKIQKHNWSGNKVMGHISFKRIRELLLSLSHRRTKQHFLRRNQFHSQIKYASRKFVENFIVTYLFFILVITNSIVLSLEGSISEELWQTLNDILTWIFFVEFLVKLSAFGQKSELC
jgi:hypothetical protein